MNFSSNSMNTWLKLIIDRNLKQKIRPLHNFNNSAIHMQPSLNPTQCYCIFVFWINYLNKFKVFLPWLQAFPADIIISVVPVVLEGFMVDSGVSQVVSGHTDGQEIVVVGHPRLQTRFSMPWPQKKQQQK